MDGKVILVTGAAGTGKSTLAKLILERAHPFRRVDYGRLLLEHKAREAGIQMTYDDLRRVSGAVVTPADVVAVDDWLIEQLPQWRTEANVIIDSHAVTKECFGFRITPYSLEQVRRVGFDAILVLVGESEELARRVATNPHGRPIVDAFEAGFQVQLQSAVAVIYAIACGRPCFALDTTRTDAGAVADVALELLCEAGVPFKRREL